jgi:hypothetical protein
MSIMNTATYIATGLPVDSAAKMTPETFRLPRPTQRDPYFGLSRTTYYELEKAGTIRLIRLRRRGNMRGLTLVPFDQMAAHLRSLTSEVPK